MKAVQLIKLNWETKYYRPTVPYFQYLILAKRCVRNQIENASTGGSPIKREIWSR